MVSTHVFVKQHLCLLAVLASSCSGSRQRNAELILTQKLVSVWQGFRSPEEVQRFSDMMEEMCYIVATKHSGSLKASSCPPLMTGCCASVLSVNPSAIMHRQ